MKILFFFLLVRVYVRARATEFLSPYQRDIVFGFVSLFLKMEEIRNL